MSVREGIGTLSPRRPVQVDVSPRATVRVVRIAVVVPCYNRRADAEAVLEDLARVEVEWRIQADAERAGTECRPTKGRPTRVDLRVLLVDNASDQPLSTVTGSWAGKKPGEGGVWLEHLRSPTNSGGSGGYNQGMARVLSWWQTAGGWDPEYVWLVDSDARVAPKTLSALLEVMERDASIVAAGSVICDPLTGQAFELGGNQNPRTGHFEPMVLGEVGVVGGDDGLVDCDYVAACCALVRSDAIRATGLFPDRFLNADDVEWFIRMKQTTGGRIVGVPSSLAMHPRFDRFPTWTRYYMCRNAMGPLEAVGGGVWSRFVRAKQEVLRAVQQAIMGRMDLAGLHVRGLKHAAEAKTIGMAPDGVIKLEPTRPWKHLREDLERQLSSRARGAGTWVLNDLAIGSEAEEEMRSHIEQMGGVCRWPTPKRERGVAASVLAAAGRWCFGPRADVAVVPARGRPSAWLSGRVMVQATPPGYVIKRYGRVRTITNAAKVLLVGGWQGLRCTFRAAEFCELPEAPSGPVAGSGMGDVRDRAALPPSAQTGSRSNEQAGESGGKTGAPTGRAAATSPMGEVGQAGRQAHAPSLTVIVLSYNRWDALRATLQSLLADPTVQAAGGAESILVADNGSTDGTPGKLAAEFPGVGVMAMDTNLGVEAFNLAVGACESDLVLVLDDDATVVPRALRSAVECLEARPELGAVAFLPRHPRTGRAEWSFGERDDVGRWTSDAWPVMGCANLVRRRDWAAAGGYEQEFFLYRNDTDLALKMLAMRRGVYFDSTWVALHDTAAGAGSRKSARWHRMATRNWVWVCRRHGRGAARVGAAAAGWVWAHALAGLSPARQWATLRGGVEGVVSAPPPLNAAVAPDGSHLAGLLALRRGAKRHRRA